MAGNLSCRDLPAPPRGNKKCHETNLTHHQNRHRDTPTKVVKEERMIFRLDEPSSSAGDEIESSHFPRQNIRTRRSDLALVFSNDDTRNFVATNESNVHPIELSSHFHFDARGQTSTMPPLDVPIPAPLTRRSRSLSMGGGASNRVLIYTTCYNVIDGVTLTIRKIEQEILASGGHVCILTTTSGNPANTNLDGTHPNRRVLFLDNAVPLPCCHDPSGVASYSLGFSLSAAMQKKLDEFEPSIVHVTVPDCTCLHLIDYARRREIPLMGTYHSNIVDYMDHYPGLGWLKPILCNWFRHNYNFLQALYVPTPFIKKHLCKSDNLDRITNLQVWGRGIDLEKFNPSHRSDKFRQKLGIRPNDVVVCFVGRLVPEKRLDIFANVVRRLAAKRVRFRALVIGAGVCEDELKSLPNTTCLGWMSADDLPVLYASSDVFLFPSAVETFGNVTLEAAASGLPLVVEAGCSGHLVRNDINGYACPADDEDAFFQGTLNLVVDHERRRAYSYQSRRHSLSFEKHTVVKQMIYHYSEVTDEFYQKYGGHHHNRDLQYTNEDSFLGGTHPRPLGLPLLEYIFMTLFRLGWVLLSFYSWCQDVILMAGYFWMQDRASMERYMEESPSPDPLVELENSYPAVMLGRQRELQLEGSAVERVDLTSSNCEVYTMKKQQSSTTLSEMESGEDTNEADNSQGGSSWNCAKVGDGSVARGLSVAFVKSVLFQWKCESRIRSLRRIRRSAPRDRRKRKDSNAPEDFHRTRLISDGSEDSDSTGSLKSFTREGCREDELERRPVRRSMSSTTLLL